MKFKNTGKRIIVPLNLKKTGIKLQGYKMQKIP